MKWPHVTAMAFGVLCIAGCVTSRGVQPALEYRHYVSPVYHWEVAYPDGWTLDSSDSYLVKINAPSTLPFALVGIHSRDRVVAQTLHEVANIYLAAWTRDTTQRGTKSELVSRRSATLRDGTPMIQVEHLIGTGLVGKSRKVIVVAHGRTFILDAESYLTSWDQLEPYFDRILTSFTVNR